MLFSVRIGIFMPIWRMCASALRPSMTVDVLTREVVPFPGGFVNV